MRKNTCPPLAFNLLTCLHQGVASQHSSYTDPGEGFNFEKRTLEYFTPLKVHLSSPCSFSIQFYETLTSENLLNLLPITAGSRSKWNDEVFVSKRLSSTKLFSYC